MADYFHVTGEERQRRCERKQLGEGFAAHANLTISFMIGALFGMRYL